MVDSNDTNAWIRLAKEVAEILDIPYEPKNKKDLFVQLINNWKGAGPSKIKIVCTNKDLEYVMSLQSIETSVTTIVPCCKLNKIILNNTQFGLDFCQESDLETVRNFVYKGDD